MELVIAAAGACLAAAAAWALRGKINTQTAGSPPDGLTRPGARASSATRASAAAVAPPTATGGTGEAALAAATHAVERRGRSCAWRSGSSSARSRSRRASATSRTASARCAERERDARAQLGEELEQAAERAAARARARRRDEPAQARQALLQRGGGGGSPREGARRAAGRGGGAPRCRAPVAQHPLGVHAAPCRGPRGGDDGVARAAAVRRHEGAHHRPRGPQHPRAREHHRGRLHHRRDAVRGGAVRLRPGAARDREADPREADRRTAASIRPGSRRPTTRPRPRSTTTSWSRASRRCSRPTCTRCIPSS